MDLYYPKYEDAELEAILQKQKSRGEPKILIMSCPRIPSAPNTLTHIVTKPSIHSKHHCLSQTNLGSVVYWNSGVHMVITLSEKQ